MRQFLLACFLLIGFSAAAFGQPVDTLSGHLTTDTTLISTKLYVLSGFVYVDSLVTMTIEPGTVIIGEQSTKGSLIVQRGAKIIAQGTPTKPIIFTSQNPPGLRARRRLGRSHHPRERHAERPGRRRHHRGRRRLGVRRRRRHRLERRVQLRPHRVPGHRVPPEQRNQRPHDGRRRQQDRHRPRPGEQQRRRFLRVVRRDRELQIPRRHQRPRRRFRHRLRLPRQAAVPLQHPRSERRRHQQQQRVRVRQRRRPAPSTRRGRTPGSRTSPRSVPRPTRPTSSTRSTGAARTSAGRARLRSTTAS